MINLTEQEITILEQDSRFKVARNDNGEVVSVTQVVDPGPLVVDDAEYLAQLFEVREIMQGMYACVKEEALGK